MRRYLVAAAAIAAITSLPGCIPLAVGYWAYEYGKSEDRESRSEVLKECIRSGKTDDPICQQFLEKERGVR